MNYSWKPKLHPDLTYSYFLVGHEKTPLLIIDNFMDEAEWLVQFCKLHHNFNATDNFYPGLRMEAPKIYIHAVNRFLAHLLENVFGLPQQYIAGGKALYSMVVTPPDQLEIKQCLPHVDSYLSGDLACVHYLCGPLFGGTSLYRHRKTGYEKITKENLDHYQQTVATEGALRLSEKAYMNGSNDYFEQVASVDAMFNRVIVYPSNVLHSGNIAPDFTFNPSPDAGRLTINSFIFSKRN